MRRGQLVATLPTLRRFVNQVEKANKRESRGERQENGGEGLAHQVTLIRAAGPSGGLLCQGSRRGDAACRTAPAAPVSAQDRPDTNRERQLAWATQAWLMDVRLL